MTSAPAGPTIRSRADVRTDSPERFAKHLVSHLGRKLAFVQDGDTATAPIGSATASVIVGDHVLVLLAQGDQESDVARVEQVLGSHLERFGHREQLSVSWDRQR
jgi:uncharacterized protein